MDHRPGLPIYAFIDGQNLHTSIAKLGWAIDYRRFRRYLRDKYKVEKAFYFIGYIETHADLYKSLQESGYTVIFKPTLKRDGIIKGNADAELVLHAMIEYPHYRQAVIVSGDGDFHCLVQYLEKKGKLAKLLVPDSKRFSSLYRYYTAYIAGVNLLRSKIEIKKRHNRGTEPFG